MFNGRGLIVNARERSGTPEQFEYVSHSNGEVRRITRDLNYYSGVSLTADYAMLATTQHDEFSVIWVAPLAEPDSAKPVTSGGQAWKPTWTVDGKVVYVLNEITRKSLWVMDADGSKPRQLTPGNETIVFRPRASADGRYIAFGSNRTGKLQIWRMDVDGGKPTQLTNSTDIGFADFDVSADGKWVIYGRWISQNGEIWKVPMEGGNPVSLNKQPGYESKLAVSPDGKYVAYAYNDSKATHPRVGSLSWRSREVRVSGYSTFSQILCGGHPIVVRFFMSRLKLAYRTSGSSQSLEGSPSSSPISATTASPASMCRGTAKGWRLNATPRRIM